MAIEEEHVLLAAERALEPAQIGRPRRKSLREVHSEQHGKVSDKWLRYLDVYEAAFASLSRSSRSHSGNRRAERRVARGVGEIFSESDRDCRLRRQSGMRKAALRRRQNQTCDRRRGATNTERAIVTHSAEFDIIIDDGSHKSSDIIKCFARYFGHLANSGIYIVEDLHCSYRKAFEGGLYDPYSSMSFFKRLVDITNSEHWGVPRQRIETLAAFAEKYSVRFDESLLASVSSMEFSNSLCVITKDALGRNDLGPRRVAGRDAAVVEKLLDRDGTLIQGTDETANPWVLDKTLEKEIEAGREGKTNLSKLQGEYKALTEVSKAGETTIAGLRTKLDETRRAQPLRLQSARTRSCCRFDEAGSWSHRKRKCCRDICGARCAESRRADRRRSATSNAHASRRVGQGERRSQPATKLERAEKRD